MKKSKLQMTDYMFERFCMYAFRYAINKHMNQAMNNVEDAIISNLSHISANYKCQMMRDILAEFEFYDNLDFEEEFGTKVCTTIDGKYSRVYYTPHYLDKMFATLKEDYKATHEGVEWKKGLQV